MLLKARQVPSMKYLIWTDQYPGACQQGLVPYGDS